MVEFRNVTNGAGVRNWWDNGENQIAFGRDDKGFVAINNEDSPIDRILQTGMPPGEYCNIAAGYYHGGECTSNTVMVDASGQAQIFVPGRTALAFHAMSKLSSLSP